ncbi:MAG: DUF4492 domain-containing protein [Muribaculaceae bacterium]|nr:DUF4492 domain-containing protein [Muribaculaceae bacterium]
MNDTARRHNPVVNALLWIWRFYSDGFRSMTVGRKLWALIIFKVIVLLLVFRLFFFPNILERDYDNDADRSDAVRSSLLDSRRY